MDGVLDFLNSIKTRQKDVAQRVADLSTILRLNKERLGVKYAPTTEALKQMAFAARMAIDGYTEGSQTKEVAVKTLDDVIKRLKQAAATVNATLGPPAYRQRKKKETPMNRLNGTSGILDVFQNKVRQRAHYAEQDITEARSAVALSKYPTAIKSLANNKLAQLERTKTQVRDLYGEKKMSATDALSRLNVVRAAARDIKAKASGVRPGSPAPKPVVMDTSNTDITNQAPATELPVSTVPSSSAQVTVPQNVPQTYAPPKPWYKSPLVIGGVVVGVGLLAWYLSRGKKANA